MTASHSSMLIFATVRSRRMPALLTSASSRPEGVDRRRDQPARGVVLGAVAGVEHRLATGGGDLVDDRLADLGIELVDHHAGALAGELERLTAADAATCAGDDRDPAVHQTHGGDPTQRPGTAGMRDRWGQDHSGSRMPPEDR